MKYKLSYKVIKLSIWYFHIICYDSSYFSMDNNLVLSRDDISYN